MGKSKKKNKRLADKVISKKKETSIETNPFEIHVNRVKHQVVGRKSKNDKGLPGIAREKALLKRKQTLLQEYKKRFKTNRFHDKRIGEKDSNMTVDEKMTARFALERKKKKKDLFNLNEDEELTHYGQTLAEIEKFDDPRSEEDEEDDELAKEFMKESHFGGFLKLKENNSVENDKPKSRKEWIEELIAMSKQRKYDRQNEKEETQEMTEKLDAYWKEVQRLMMSQKASNRDSKITLKDDSYDVMVRSLKFESRAKASDRLKTPEELAQEEKENLERLEAERIRRMHGSDELKAKNASQHKSADDLDDNFYLEDKTDRKKVRFLEYKDGKLISDDEDDKIGQSDKIGDHSNDSQDDSKSDADSTEENAVSEAEDSEKDEDEIEDGEKADETSSDEDSEEDNFSDLVTDEESDGESEKNISSKKNKKSPKKSENESESSVKLTIDENKNELPYVFSAPSSYEEFIELIKNYSNEDVLTIIERIIKLHHVSLAKENKQKLELLFTILLQYIQDLASKNHPNLNIVDQLAPYIFNLALVSPLNAGQCMKEILKEKYEEFSQSCHFYLSGERGPFPGLDTLIFFKVIAVLFSTSDFHHPVASPAMLFMGQILSKCRVKNLRDAVRGLFVCTTFYEYVSFSKRFVPECLNFLSGMLSLCIGNDSKKPCPVIHPFKVFDNPFLKVESPIDIDIAPLGLNMMWLADDLEITDSVRLSILKTTFDLIKLFAQLYDGLLSFREIFKPLQIWWKKLPLEKYPKEIKEIIEHLEDMMEKPREYTSLKSERKRPKSLKLLNPKIDPNFDGEKRHRGGRQNNEKERLLHRYKREFKGAMREIRQDNHFLAKQQLDERLERDAERKRKVKELYSSLANQEGDFKALVKQKRKK